MTIICSYRYSYIVHPLAYRASTDALPDNCCVDAIQWCILNIVEEPHYNNPEMWKGPCHGIELFNDFTYNVSYNSELSKSVIDDPKFVMPCYNGKTLITTIMKTFISNQRVSQYSISKSLIPLSVLKYTLSIGLLSF